MNVISCTLLAFLGWGVADFLSFILSKQMNQRVALIFIQLYGVIGLIAYIAYRGTFPLSNVAILDLLLSSIFYCIAWLAYFRALREGILSVVSPVSACFGIVSAAIGYFYFQDRLNRFQLMAVVFAVIGVILISIDIKEILASRNINVLSKGLQYAMLAMLGWGLIPLFWRSSVLRIGAVHTVLITKSLSIIILGFSALTVKEFFMSSLTVESQLLLLCAGTLDTLALIAYSIGMTINTTLIAPIATSYTALSVLLALALLGERLRRYQWIGVGMIIGALVTLSAASY